MKVTSIEPIAIRHRRFKIMQRHTGNFAISKSAYSILFDNKASSCAICSYLVIARYTNGDGTKSTVGYSLIKKRLGVGQRLVEGAIAWLISHRLIEKGPDNNLSLYKIKAMRGDTDFSYRWRLKTISKKWEAKIWFDNSIVGEPDDKVRPLKELKHRDTAARLLLFLTSHYDKLQYCVNPEEYCIKFLLLKDSYNGSDRHFSWDHHVIQAQMRQKVYAKNELVLDGLYEEALKELEKKGFVYRRIVVIGKDLRKVSGARPNTRLRSKSQKPPEPVDEILYELDVKNVKTHMPRDIYMLADEIDAVVSAIGFNTARVGKDGKKRFYDKYSAVVSIGFEN